MREVVNTVQEPMVDLKENEIHINYSPINGNSIYDLCSLEGRILITGKLNQSDNHIIDMSGFPGGDYNLFILDGDQVFKNTLRV